MIKLTFHQQIRLAFLILIVCALLSLIFNLQILYKIGVMIYGLLFLIHPVFPKTAKPNRYGKLCVRIFGGLIFYIGLTGRL